MFLAHTFALLTPKFFCIKIVNLTMLFQNQLRKSWGKKGNDAQTAILILKSIPKKTYYILFVSIVNFVALDKINK